MKGKLESNKIMKLYAPSDFNVSVDEDAYKFEDSESSQSPNESPENREDEEFIDPHIDENFDFKNKVSNLEKKLKNQNSRINDLEEEKKLLKDEADAKYLSKCMLFFDRYHLKTIFLKDWICKEN